MTGFEWDWRVVLRHTAVPLVTALAAVVALGAGAWLQAQAEHRHAVVSVNHDAVHEDYDALVYRRRLVDRYHRRYEQLHRAGFVGREDRLDWVETLREAATALTLPRVSYAIEPQLRVVAPVESIAAADNLQIHVSRLQLEIGLVHEIDLLRYVDALQQNAPGLIKIDSCELSWQAESATTSAVEANILANCSIQIFSVVTSDVTVAETAT